MRLYHSPFSNESRLDSSRSSARWTAVITIFLAILLLTLLSACSAALTTPSLVSATIQVDGKQIPIQVPANSTVQDALDTAGLKLADLDRSEPPAYTLLTSGMKIQVVRVREEFEITQQTIPFDRQTIRNESLPQEERIYLQKGQNGLEEVTYRKVYEDGVEVAQPTAIKKVVLKEPVPEIVMVGIQAPFVPVAIPGKLVYLRDGNAWLMEGSSADRRALVTSGDLDGRVLSLSSNGNWLLFTRRSDDKDQINRLWALELSNPESKPIDLQVSNIVHFADWIPGSDSKVVFSTVEPRNTAPGWQANNDLYALSFSPSGWVSKWKEKPILEPNYGGVYGWWGMNFTWSPDGKQLAFARPDEIGLLDFYQGTLSTVMDIVPLQPRGDWAWVPGLTWGSDGKTLFTVDHVVPPGAVAPEESPNFDMTALPLAGGGALHLASQTGMFTYPIPSPLQKQLSGEDAYQIAYLQAIFPNQSETSRYRLMVMDRDGSNQRLLFPTQERSGGLMPQREWGAWSPAPLPDSGNYALAIIYEGNLWLVDVKTGDASQITGDGLTTRVVWGIGG